MDFLATALFFGALGFVFGYCTAHAKSITEEPVEINERGFPCYLSRCADDKFMLTIHKPIRKRVGSTKREDLYVSPGDPLGHRHICPWSIGAMGLGRLPPIRPLQSLQIYVVVKPRKPIK